MFSYLRSSKLAAITVLAVFVFSPIRATPVGATESYPQVARLSFVSGGVTLSRGDDPDEWDDALENAPLTVGDRLYAPANARAELQLPSGNFVRLAPASYLSTLNLSDDVKQFYLGEGTASLDIRRLAPDEVFEIDTPNVSVTLEEPGRYRVAVDENGDSRITVRRGRASVAASGRQITVENSEMRIYGIDAPRYEIAGLPASDGFDGWVAERNDRFERAYSDAYRYASEDIIGAEDLVQQGRWEQIPDYGYAWTPTVVAAGWSPFSNGRWYWKDPWGWSWVSRERWGWATSHYGRWTPYRSRWYWVPVRPRTRVRYAPACVEFVRVRDHVGWFPLHPRDRHIPWWERRDRRFDRNATYVNRNHVTVIHHNHFIAARPVSRYVVRDAVIVRDARSARFTEALPIPNRSSLRLVSDDGRRSGYRPSDRVLDRVAVVRTAPPAPPRSFRDKLPEIQKNQGRPVEPERITAAALDDRRAGRVRVRPAAETGRGDFAPRNPSANTGPALQPVTEARGKPLETRALGPDAERTRKLPTAQAPVTTEPASAAPSRDQERERRAQEQKQQELERRQAQQKEAERKAQAQKQSTPPRQAVPRTSEQQRLEQLERETRQSEQDSKEQARREALKQQQSRQAEQQRRQELERRQKAQLQQQEQARQQQFRQQQAVERQARDQQLRQQQEVERRQLHQSRGQNPAPPQLQPQEQARQQQLRQQQLPAQREAQQTQRQQQQDRRPQLRQLPPQERPPMPQPQTLPAR